MRRRITTQASLKKLSDKTLKKNMMQLNDIINKQKVYGVKDVKLQQMFEKEMIRRKLQVFDI